MYTSLIRSMRVQRPTMSLLRGGALALGMFAALSIAVPLTPSLAETRSGLASISREDLASAKTSVATALEAGHHVLFVELYGSDLYVFDATHKVGGPVVRVLELLGFESILPDSVTIDSSGARSVPMETLDHAEVEHVFLLNFSPSEETVGALEARLREISGGRLYRLDATTSEAFSDRWVEQALLPRIAAAISDGRS